MSAKTDRAAHVLVILLETRLACKGVVGGRGKKVPGLSLRLPGLVSDTSPSFLDRLSVPVTPVSIKINRDSYKFIEITFDNA